MDLNDCKDFLSKDIVSFSDWLFSLNPYEFSFIAVVFGFVISPNLTVNQQNSLGNFLELTGQVILTINAQATTLEQACNKTSSIKPEIESNNLEEEIVNIKKELIKLRKDALGNDKE